MADLGFDLRNVDETKTANYDPIPNGIYAVQITGSEAKQNQKKNGSYVSMEFTIVDKNFNGRKLWHNFNLFNPSEKAQNIGRAEIKRCILACGLPDTTRDTSYLHGKMLKVKVAIEDRKEYGLSNIVKDFYSIKEGNSNVTVQQPQQTQPQKQPVQNPIPQAVSNPLPSPQSAFPPAPVDYSNVPRPEWMAPIAQ